MEGMEGCGLEGVNVGEFWEGLGMDTDWGFGFLLFRGTWRPSLQSLRSGLGPYWDYKVRRCPPIFPYVIPDAKVHLHESLSNVSKRKSTSPEVKFGNSSITASLLIFWNEG